MDRPPPGERPKKKSGRRQAEPDLFEAVVPAANSTTAVRFAGTDNPRYLRALHALLLRPVPREHLDRAAGCSNGPDLVSNLRDLGLGPTGLPCTFIPDRDQDGKKIRRGVYHLTEAGRRAVNAWLRLRDRKAGE
ncbi:hypothetical protein [Pseudoduganella namucuonensis]|uniref:hypothetical protein n=1 Tax=Pseudoduganella namucuonensis TaxID=1035707 RepID=UPI0015A567E4|nr:hypothetical protein [Pseudoduganella namucuonensis]